MRKILILCALAMGVILQSAYAQADKKAKEVLDAAYKKINSAKTVKADFSLELKGGGVDDKKKGTFVMKGPKYRVNIAGQEIICDNKTVWTYIQATNEVQVTEYNPDAQTISPTKLFTNGFVEKEYNYKYAGERKINGKVCDIIELTPKDADKMFTKVQMSVDKSNNIMGGQVWEKNGNTYRYDISNYVINSNTVTDATFTFDAKKHPGVEVIDLR
ncbi:MAG: outer membrane lipoprotein carrier protein LolA [Chitinophagaceae bacterium]|nr:outer membrane lipoprotein carrier protein LolA [Chitinophagaceae bacterium]MCB9047144.1 outer membrane lipoprotein carrier protein LolA [Chitinophagales bacterium]